MSSDSHRGAPTGDFADALSSALRASGLTLTTLRNQLVERGHRVSVATLSYWQTGRSLPTRAGSLATVRAIEELLGLPSNSLTDPLNESMRPAYSPMSRLPDATAPTQAMEQLGLSFSMPYSIMVIHDVVHTGARGQVERQLVRQMIRADGTGVSRLPLVFHATEPDTMPELRPTHGVTLGRQVLTSDGMCLVVELLLPHVLEPGEMHWFEYEALWPARPDEAQYTHGRNVSRGATFLVVGAVFEGQRPQRARFLHTGSEDAGESEVRSWDPVPREVQHCVRNAPAGVYEVEWYVTEPDEGH